MSLYQSAGCSPGEYSLVQSNGSAIADVNDCSILLGDVVPPLQVQTARWIGLVAALLFFVISLYKLSLFYRKLKESIPGQAYVIISWYNIALILGYVDPTAANGLFPIEVRFLIRFISTTALLSLLVVAAWGLLDAVFRKLNRQLDSWLQTRHVQLLFVLIASLNFVALYPTKNSDFLGGQRVILAVEVTILGIFGLVNGFKMHQLLMEQLKLFGAEYKKAVFKTRILIAMILVAVISSIIMNIRRAVEHFEDDGSHSVLHSERDLQKKFWSSMIYTYFVMLLVNLLAFVLFKAPQKGLTTKVTNTIQLQDGATSRRDSRSARNSDRIASPLPTSPESPTALPRVSAP